MDDGRGTAEEFPDPPWLVEGTRIVHSALGAGRVVRIDDRAGRAWVRLRFDGSGAMLAMPLDQLRPHVRPADDTNRGADPHRRRGRRVPDNGGI